MTDARYIALPLISRYHCLDPTNRDISGLHCTIQQEAITRANVDPVQCCHMASLDHNELTISVSKKRFMVTTNIFSYENKECHPGVHYWDYHPGGQSSMSSHCNSFEERAAINFIYRGYSAKRALSARQIGSFWQDTLDMAVPRLQMGCRDDYVTRGYQDNSPQEWPPGGKLNPATS